MRHWIASTGYGQTDKEASMKKETIKKILKLHYIPYILEGDRILADSMIGGKKLFEVTEDVTDWTKKELYDWLGY